jgi:hypothetical protein
LEIRRLHSEFTVPFLGIHKWESTRHLYWILTGPSFAVREPPASSYSKSQGWRNSGGPKTLQPETGTEANHDQKKTTRTAAFIADLATAV